MIAKSVEVEIMDIKKISEFLKVLATLPDNEQEKVLAYAQGVSAATVAKTTSNEKVSAWAKPGGTYEGGEQHDRESKISVWRI